jgi:hypothetical protein
MSLEAAREQFKSYADGDAVPAEAISLLHALFPNDFEFYSIAFELINKLGVPTDRFILPVMPDSIEISKRKITNVRKTAQGVSVLTNNSFVPIDIKISGSFGRKFKMMVGSYEMPNLADGLPTSIPFAGTVKTGYGAVKMLERLYEKSTRASNGKTNRLIFYNLAFNQQYAVKILNFQASQSVSENMIWRYSMTIQAISPSGNVIGRAAKAMEMMGFASINNRLNKTVVEDTMQAFNENVPPVI